MNTCWFCFRPFPSHAATCVSKAFDDLQRGSYLVHPSATQSKAPPLAERVDADLDAIVASDPGFFSGEAAPAELPRPAPDYTRYVDALASAVKKCDHPNAVNVRYAREWHCPDCGKYVSRADLKGSWWMYG